MWTRGPSSMDSPCAESRRRSPLTSPPSLTVPCGNRPSALLICADMCGGEPGLRVMVTRMELPFKRWLGALPLGRWFGMQCPNCLEYEFAGDFDTEVIGIGKRDGPRSSKRPSTGIERAGMFGRMWSISETVVTSAGCPPASGNATPICADMWSDGVRVPLVASVDRRCAGCILGVRGAGS